MTDYIVDFDHLMGIQAKISARTNDVIEDLYALSQNIGNYTKDARITSEGMDAAKLYMEIVHSQIIAAFYQLFQNHYEHFFTYLQDYQDLDTSPHAHIEAENLRNRTEQLSGNCKNYRSLDWEANSILSEITDIAAIPKANLEGVDGLYAEADHRLTRLMENINELEDRHLANDFADNEQLINTTRALIENCLSRQRNFNSPIEDLSNLLDPAFALQEQLAIHEAATDAYQDQYLKATNHAQERAEVIVQEQKEREQVAMIINGVVWVAGTAVTICTAGAGTGIVIGAGVAVAAVTAGTEYFTQEYVDHGNLFANADLVDWGTGCQKIVIAGGKAFIEKGISKGVENLVKGSKLYTMLSQHPNAMKRIMCNGGVDLATDIPSHMVGRGFEGAARVATGESKKKLGDEILDSMFDKDEIIGDITGSVTGTVSEDVLGHTVFKKYKGSTSIKERMLGGGLTKASSETFSGITERTAKEISATGDVFKGLEKGFDQEEMGKDLISGFASGAKGEMDATMKQRAAERMAQDYNKDVQRNIQERKLQGVVTGENGGADFSFSKYIYRDDSGQPVQVRIVTNGDQNLNIKQANKIASEQFHVDADNLIAGSDGIKYTWMPMTNFDSRDNTVTMQLVEADKVAGLQNADGNTMFDYIYRKKVKVENPMDENGNPIKKTVYVEFDKKYKNVSEGVKDRYRNLFENDL